MKRPGKSVLRAVSILMAIALFCLPLSVQPCQMSEVSNNPCCCCSDSRDFSEANHREKQECGCHMGERHQDESSPAVVLLHRADKLGTSFVASDVEVTTKDYPAQLTVLHSRPFLPASKDPPLYLVHSSFLI